MLNKKTKQSIRYWTYDDIVMLKKGHAQGKKIKDLSCELGRSPTAVSKFLTRSGIKNGETAIVSKKMNVSFRREKKFYAEQSIVCSTFNKRFADINLVFSYLSSKGYRVSQPTQYLPSALNDCVFINNKPYLKTRALLLANRLRAEEGKHPFDVPEIMSC